MTFEHDIEIEDALLGGVPKRGMARSQFSSQGPPCGGRESVQPTRDNAFEGACGLVDILSVGGSDRGSSDSRPSATAIDDQQPFGQQTMDCLTYRRAAHVQMSGERGL
jgi:hypothetical protein